MDNTTHGYPGGTPAPPNTPKLPTSTTSETDNRSTDNKPSRSAATFRSKTLLAAAALTTLAATIWVIQQSDDSTPTPSGATTEQTAATTPDEQLPPTTTTTTPQPAPAPNGTVNNQPHDGRWQKVGSALCSDMTEPGGKYAVMPPGTPGPVNGIGVTGNLPATAWHINLPEEVNTGSLGGERTDSTRPFTGYIDGSLAFTTSQRGSGAGTSITLYNQSDGTIRGSLHIDEQFEVLTDEQFIYILDPGIEPTQARVAFVDGTGTTVGCFKQYPRNGTLIPLTADNRNVIAHNGRLFTLDTTATPPHLEQLSLDTTEKWEPAVDIDELYAIGRQDDTDLLVAGATTATGQTLELFQLTPSTAVHTASLNVTRFVDTPWPRQLEETTAALAGTALDPLHDQAPTWVTHVDINSGDTTLAIITLRTDSTPQTDTIVAVDTADVQALWRTSMPTKTWTTDLFAVSDKHIAATFLPLNDTDPAATVLIEPRTGTLIDIYPTAAAVGSASKASNLFTTHPADNEQGTRLVVLAEGKMWGALTVENGTAVPLVASDNIIATFVEQGANRYITAHPLDGGGSNSSCPACDL